MKVNFTLDQLIVLQAIVEQGSFSKAAQKTYRVPSAISYSIRSLEDALGFEIFDRSKRKAVLSRNGKSFYQQSKHLIENATQLQTFANNLKGGWEPEVQIIIDGLFPMTIINQVLFTLTKQEIPTRVRVNIEYQGGVTERFVHDKADMMVVLDFTEPGENLNIADLPPIEALLVSSTDHPLGKAGLKDPISPSGYIELLIRDSAVLCNQPLSHTNSTVYLSDFHSKRLALLSGIGFGWMPRYLIQEDLIAGRLVQLPYCPNHRIYHPKLITRKHGLGKVGQIFRKALLQETALVS